MAHGINDVSDADPLHFRDTSDDLGTRTGAVIANIDLPADCRTIVLLTAGNITIVPRNSPDVDAIAFVGLPAGYVFPYEVKKVTVFAVGATAAQVRK